MKVFWDTNLFIYLWERKSLTKEMGVLIAFMENGSHTLVTSSLSLGEILVQPMRLGRTDLVDRYREAMQRLVLIPFENRAASVFAELRATHTGLRPPDAIQLACALQGSCDLFLTNDDRLSQLPLPLKILSLRKWNESVAGG